ncbi:DNA repair protein RadC [Pseudoalteromonas sp. Cnat2-41]|uniref:RadC family protein n=1 Tax=unclassified Pseudoalteromonas TaxID=194690 RepID=UPI001EF8E1E1|nr:MULTISPECIES: DNA repair protein RadC [unclassified Pseudoalteromonas]MCF2862063.1 DNA repair protein RadC [Pseudoalteromonas sp. CNAT2-18]MCG7558168.1 DNA repair protein RadC [Pseudoalteromonas sp. CNAT2-18.1]
MRLTDLPAQQRPREKLLTQGAGVLSDAELLAIFFRTGIAGCNAIDLAQQILSQSQGLHTLLAAEHDHFCRFKGMGTAKYTQLQAAIELARRYLQTSLERALSFDSPQAVQDYLKLELKGLQREVFLVLFVDAQHRLISTETLFQGTIDAASVYPREVVKAALKHNAAAVIFAHNHPSGIAEPSQADEVITRKLIQALGLVDIRVLDHLVIGGCHAVSFAERGLL